MRSQNSWTGIVMGVFMGVFFSAVVVLAGGLEPGGGPTQGGSSNAPVPRTGQTPTVPFAAPAGSDGDLQKGVAWPNPRFTDNNNGTVTDNLTGLIWLKEANCKDMVGGIDKSLDLGKLSWAKALTWSNNFASGECSLTDGSTAGQWRLPNLREMQSLIHYGFVNPTLPNTSGLGQWTEGNPFTGVQSTTYWSSTTGAANPASA